MDPQPQEQQPQQQQQPVKQATPQPQPQPQQQLTLDMRAVEKLVASAFPGQRVEWVHCPDVPPARNVPSVKFSTTDEFKAGLEKLDKGKCGNGELVQVYFKRVRMPVPGKDGQSVAYQNANIADFATVQA